MKLTVYAKEAIVRSIMNDVPVVNEAKLLAEVQAALVVGMSPEVQALYKTHSGALRGDRQYFSSIRNSAWFIKGDADFNAVLKPFLKFEEARSQAERDLFNALKTCSTLKQAQAMFPEFVKYMPTEEQPTKNLPALANVVSGLVAMGWPKTEGAAK